MKVTLVVPAFPKLSETFIVNKVLGLIDAGFDIAVLVQKFDEKAWRQFPALAARPEVARRIVEIPERSGPLAMVAACGKLASLLATRPGLVLRYARNGYRAIGPRVFRCLLRDLWILGTAPELVHFEFGTLSVNRAEIGKWIGCKVVTSFRGYDLNYVGLDDPDYYKGVWDSADAVHCLGQDLWNRAIRRGCSPDKWHVLISPCIDAECFSPRPRPAEDRLGTEARPMRVLSVGRLDWKKGHEYALSAIRMLLDRGVQARLEIIGSGEYLEAVMFCRRQLGLESHVEIVGGAPQAEVRERMQKADVFLHAAISEGFCNAVLEAQAMELPVVTSDADGLRENVVDGVTGFAVRRREPEELARQMERLAGDGELRRRMGAAGRRRVLEQFQLAGQIRAFARFYEAVLSGSGS